jgi:trk system potassium uptake protein TrkA
MAKNLKFAVIGLGYFGVNLSLRLVEEGAEVIGIDIDESKVQFLTDKITYSVQMDSTDVLSLRKLGLKEMDGVIVAIGENFEASILTTALLIEIGVTKIINRVTSPTHEQILNAMNITDVIVPEAIAAAQLADRMMIKGVLGSFEISKEYSIVEIKAPKQFVGKSLLELNLRNEYSLNLVTIKRIESKNTGLLTMGERRDVVRILGVPTPSEVIYANDILVVFGLEKDIFKLSELGSE